MRSLSTVFLIAANLIPVIGVVFLGWSLFAVMFFYWSENIVIGFYNVLKMAKAEKVDPLERGIKINSFGKVSYSNKKSSYILFFLFHYFFFMIGHGVFVFSFFGPPDIPIVGLIAGLASLFISHGISYFENFIAKEEYKRVSPGKLFAQPYKRVMVMHLTIVLSGFAVKSLGMPLFSILLLTVLKIIVDLGSHALEHKKFSREPGTSDLPQQAT